MLCLHRIRQGLIKTRTATINQLRGLLSEFGIVMPQGRYSAQNTIGRVLKDAENGLLILDRELLQDLSNKIQNLKLDVLHYDRRVSTLVRGMASAKAIRIFQVSVSTVPLSRPSMPPNNLALAFNLPLG
ncbi:hypothetical protein VCRA2110O135_170013 [Vibrio crassostreae]|nr:hypothetical protein VCRA2110O135_170013 [Vibrio crassostreae]